LKASGSVGSDRAGLSWITDVSVGGLAVLLAIILATRTDARFKTRRRTDGHHARAAHEAKEPLTQRILSHGTVPVVFLAALAINLPGAAYLIGLRDIAAGDHDTGMVVLLVVAFNAIMFVLAEVPLVGLAVAPDRTVAAVDDVNGWVSDNGRRIAVVLSMVLGAFLIARGIVKA
jgi:hypothetical protein